MTSSKSLQLLVPQLPIDVAFGYLFFAWLSGCLVPPSRSCHPTPSWDPQVLPHERGWCQAVVQKPAPDCPEKCQASARLDVHCSAAGGCCRKWLWEGAALAAAVPSELSTQVSHVSNGPFPSPGALHSPVSYPGNTVKALHIVYSSSKAFSRQTRKKQDKKLLLSHNSLAWKRLRMQNFNFLFIYSMPSVFFGYERGHMSLTLISSY